MSKIIDFPLSKLPRPRNETERAAMELQCAHSLDEAISIVNYLSDIIGRYEEKGYGFSETLFDRARAVRIR